MSAAPSELREGTFYVVDEDRVAVVAGPFESHTDAREATSSPSHIVAAARVLDLLEMQSTRPLRWETGDVHVVTDGGRPRTFRNAVDEVVFDDHIWNHLEGAAGSCYTFDAPNSEFEAELEALVDEAHDLLKRARRLRAAELAHAHVEEFGEDYVDADHRLAAAEPATQPADAPRDGNGDPVFEGGAE